MARRTPYELPPKEIYEFIKLFDHHQDFAEFARSQLGLTNSELSDMRVDHVGSKEQKFQMISLWKRRNGRRGTIEKLYDLDRDFRQVDDANNEEMNGAQSLNSALPPRNDHTSTANDMPIVGLAESGDHVVGAGAQITPQQLRREEPRNDGARTRQNTTPSEDPVTQGSKAFIGDITSFKNPAGGHSIQSASPSLPVGGTDIPPQPHSVIGPDVGGITQHLGATSLGGNASFCDEVTNLLVDPCTPEKVRHLMELDGVYPIGNSPKGFVLIINNYFRGRTGERTGSERDVTNMKNLWEGLGCLVRVREDLKAVEIRTVLKKVAESTTLVKYDFLVIFVMSHGGMKNGIEIVKGDGDDEDSVPVYQILSQFDNDKCKVPIPKLFFFQFCRGSVVDEGITDKDQMLGDLLQSLSRFQFDEDLEESDHTTRFRPRRSDLLISYATQSGFTALRNSKGSWFINAIANIFMRYAKEEHVAEMMTRVRSAVMAKTGKTRDNNNECIINCMEMSESKDLLTKKLYLLPGHPNNDPLDN